MPDTDAEAITIKMNDAAVAKLEQRHGKRDGLVEATTASTQLMITEVVEFCLQPSIFPLLKAYMASDDSLSGPAHTLMRLVSPGVLRHLHGLLVEGGRQL